MGSSSSCVVLLDCAPTGIAGGAPLIGTPPPAPRALAVMGRSRQECLSPAA
ncbi:hypothetical protein HMPREF1550_00968 [Actinomyces sp. oral taxon 877 str. F0543]|nr:hypothetical protein HMPREF1550_00968 [Actinomyces sp. oral taxon 877 str. F0543]